ncbi:F0F1 ATP synthase subunit alpha [Candidatus Legionella polyplacis]|uniref:ATP synthase subunit alpha n=1 Tax=Candidatus Legionella polyplacis TaxID=2005262 RepID=A0ABZ2GYM1_9GAMM
MLKNINLSEMEISDALKKRIEELDISYEMRNEGTVISVKDGIVEISGLSDVFLGEMIYFYQNDIFGLVLGFNDTYVNAIILGEYLRLSEGQKVRCTGNYLEIPVGYNFLGRIVNPLGIPIDGKGTIHFDKMLPIERDAPKLISRKSISQPVHTGLKSIDIMTPVGRGQRELIIGDRQTGKTTIAMDIIINQKNTGIKCIYVAIGQKLSSVISNVKILEKNDAMKHTIFVVASASDSASLQFISPYSACSMGEFFMENGEDAIIIYDDLTRQAWAYRQISLLLRRSPGREAYPGDIFYLHSRLLERSARIREEEVEKLTNGKIRGKTGSLTAFPIIETQSGDVSSFVPTNVISITDGQIFLDSDLFNSGIRPAVNSGLSVSRVGSSAQTDIIKKLSGNIRLSLAQYHELEAFSQFSSDLDKMTLMQLDRGKRVMELLRQKKYSPVSVFEISISIIALDKGYLDDIPIDKINIFEKSLYDYSKINYKQFIQEVNKEALYSENVLSKMIDIILGFKKEYLTNLN